MSALVLAEHDNQKLNHATLTTLNAAKQCSDQITVLIAGSGCAEVANETAQLDGVAQVFCVDDPIYLHPLAEPISALVETLVDGFEYLLAPATTFGKNILPRVAAKKDVAMVSDVIEIVSADTFVRPIYAGNAFATVQSTDEFKVLSVRATAFNAVDAQGESGNYASIDQRSAVAFSDVSHFVSSELSQSDRPELASADIVVSGGRALGSAENFQLVEALADQLGAAVGASRAAVDAGFVPNDYQVGQTGKVVAPSLYIAVGLSGAIQHLAGMKESKIIVAINTDEEAPIFQIADYGLVADLFEVLPELTQKLAEKNHEQ